MQPIEIILNIVSLIFIELSINIFLGYLIPKLKKKEIEYEEKTQEKKVVKLNKAFLNIFIICAIIVDIVGIIILIFPSLIKDILQLNYTVTIILWWLPLIFDNVILYFMMTEASYNDTEITVKKVFFKPKTYKFDDIVSFSKTGNLKIKTTKGNILLFNAMSGANSLRNFLSQKCKTNKSDADKN